MRKYVLHIFVILLCVALYFLTKGQRTETIIFWGFSENKEHEVNFDYDVKVVEIPVNSGQYVKKGDQIIKVERTSNPTRLIELDNKISLLELKKETRINAIQNEIKSLQLKNLSRNTQLDNEIRKLEAEMARKSALRELINDIEIVYDTTITGANQIDLEHLKIQRTNINKPINLQISFLREDLQSLKKEIDLGISKLQEEKDFYVNQEKNLFILAPSDGIVGFIRCSPGENYSSFSKLLSLYDPHPQLVKAYILESMITNLEINDMVRVTSTLNHENQYTGRITGFGTRILQIPNRLSKIPELKMYGREVLIQIPAENDLLQKEKVQVELISNNSEL